MLSPYFYCLKPISSAINNRKANIQAYLRKGNKKSG